MTPLDLLRLKPKSASSDILIRHLVSVGGMFGSMRKAIASQLKMLACGTSPRTSFRIADSEILSYTGIESAAIEINIVGTASSLFDSTNENINSISKQKPGSVNYAAQIKKVLYWPKSDNTTPKESPVPLRERFSKVPSHKRALSVRSNISSPSNRKKMAMGVSRGVIESMPHLSVRKTPSSSFSRMLISSPCSVDKQKGVSILLDKTSRRLNEKHGSSSIGKRLGSQYLCFGGSSLAVKKTVVRCHVASVA